MNMNQSIKQRLKELNIDDNKMVDSTVAAMTMQAYEQPIELIKIMQDQQEAESTVVKARFLLLSLGNLGFSPMLDSIDLDNPDNMMFSLQSAVGQHKENQARLVRRLNDLLDDKRKLTTPERPMNTEESPPEKRVCDEAYVLMRGLCALENAEDAMVNAGLFIAAMDDKERDGEIDRLKKSKEWISLQEQADDVPLIE